MLKVTLYPLLLALLLAGPALAQQVPHDSTLAEKVKARRLVTVDISKPQPPQPKPLFLVNSQIVLGNAVETINPDDIQAAEVRLKDIPAQWQSLAKGGAVLIQLKRGIHVPARSLPSLRRQLHVRRPVRYELDGQLVQDPKLCIATVAIGQLAVRSPAPGEAASTVAISLKPYVPQPKNGSPGTLYIRGAAGR